MSPARIVALAEVLAMLDACAQGHSRTATDHHFRVSWNGRVYPSLPLGEHGRGRQSGRTEIFGGHVRQLIRHLEIDEACARRSIPHLFN